MQLHAQVADVGEIVRIEVSSYQTALDFADQAQPHTTQQARFSLQHAVAVALLRGDFDFADTLPESLAHPALVRLRAATQVRATPRWSHAYPAHYGAQVRVWLRDGRRLAAEVADAPGDPDNPLSNAAVLAKAQRVMQAAGHAPQPVTALIQACADLPHAPSLEGLWRALHQLRWA
jgi:2-methylcitrate dehydratase PrpD